MGQLVSFFARGSREEYKMKVGEGALGLAGEGAKRERTVEVTVSTTDMTLTSMLAVGSMPRADALCGDVGCRVLPRGGEQGALVKPQASRCFPDSHRGGGCRPCPCHRGEFFRDCQAAALPVIRFRKNDVYRVHFLFEYLE